jgi:heme/copper-type cytochrome/quinol oxidase subunit 2
VVSFCLLLFAAPHTASACAICFGDPDSPWTKALSWGILALLAVVLLVLGGIVAFFIHMSKRARLSQIPATQEELQP